MAIEWWLGCGVFTFWLDGGAIILNQRLETNTETAKLNNPVKNIYFLRDIPTILLFIGQSNGMY